PGFALHAGSHDGETWWLDPTNPVFIPGFTIPDIQQRWAVVMDAKGQVRREDIALESPVSGVGVTRSERFTQAGQAEVRASVNV
ncbi:cysteine protease, partial [Xylella fastidiosa subsp. multiplex]|nr:cysteine protease [Xylella fastidiosa subsp. multiplex]